MIDDVTRPLAVGAVRPAGAGVPAGPQAPSDGRTLALTAAMLLAAVGLGLALIATPVGGLSLDAACNDTATATWTCATWRGLVVSTPMPVVFASIALCGVALTRRRRSTVVAWTGAALALCVVDVVAFLVAVLTV